MASSKFIIKLISVLIVSVQCLGESFEHYFTEYQVVPDILNAVPKEPLIAKFTDKETIIGENGVEVTPTQAQNIPDLEWNAKEDSFYNFIMVDGDPSTPGFRSWLLLSIVNIPGRDVNKGDLFVEYISPVPVEGTGFHRIVMVMFEQKGKQSFEGQLRLDNKSVAHRAKFSISDYAKKHNLGDPVAGNFFRSEYDEMVAILHQRFSYRHSEAKELAKV